jgi:hypothetical protein
MTNVFAPFGFAESHRLGAAPDYQMSRRWVNPANANPIYFGDPVSMVPTSGFIAQSAPGTFQVAGVFAGCQYVSKAAKKIIWSPWWPGTTGDVVTSGTGFDIEAKVLDDPLLAFRVQANGQMTIAMINAAPAATATFPFRIIDIIRDPPGVNGTDITTPYSWAFVAFNNQDYKALTGHG